MSTVLVIRIRRTKPFIGFVFQSFFFSVLGLLGSIPHAFVLEWFNDVNEHVLPYLHFGALVVVFAMFFYVRLSIVMSIGILFYCLLCLFGIAFIENLEPFGFSLFQVSFILFIMAWIVQFIGHKIEGKKPSFFKDVQFLLIGPAWLMSMIFKKIGVKY